MSRHACAMSSDLDRVTFDQLQNCIERPHMWFYGGWCLQRGDHSTLRIWKGRMRDTPPEKENTP